MDEGIDDPRLSAEGELAMMRLALDDGEIEHAAKHLAGAMGYQPDLPEAHEALGDLVAKLGSGALDLFPVDGDVYIGTVAARAHVLAALDQPAQALDLLVAATRTQPELPWGRVAWLADPGLAARLRPQELTNVFIAVCRGLADPVPEEERAPFLPYLRLAERAVAAYPREPVMLSAASAVGRRLGAIDAAIDWARTATELDSSKITEVWLGYAYRAAGRVDDALAAWQRGLHHEPDNFALYADIAGLLAQNGRLDEAIGWTDRALAADPTYDCAVHTGARLRFARDGDVAHLVGLADFIREHRDESHEHSDLAEAGYQTPWLGYLPGPGESCINVLDQVRDTEGDLSGGQMSISGMEPPSALATMHRVVPGLTIEIQRVHEPDPRVPVRTGSVTLWRFDGTEPVPVPAAPPAASAQALARVVRYRIGHPPAAYDHAVALADVPLDDLVALLVHPPRPPAGTPFERYPELWFKCAPVWACLGILHHRADEPWATSTRRRVLLDIAYGVEDWTTEAALYALAVAAWVDPAVRTDVAHQVSDRFLGAAEAYRHRPVTIVDNLASLVLATPGVPAQVRVLARDLNRGDAGPGSAPPPPATRKSWLGRLRRP